MLKDINEYNYSPEKEKKYFNRDDVD